MLLTSPEPRYASLPNIMKAKKKPLKKYTVADLGLEKEVAPRHEILKVAEPPKRQGGAKVRTTRATGLRHAVGQLLTTAGRECGRAPWQAQGLGPYLDMRSGPVSACVKSYRDRAIGLCAMSIRKTMSLPALLRFARRALRRLVPDPHRAPPHVCG